MRRSEDDERLAYLWGCYRDVGYSATPVGQVYKAMWLRLVRERDARLGFGSWEAAVPADNSGKRERTRLPPKTPLRATIGDMLAAKLRR